jgi:hypothetical protein
LIDFRRSKTTAEQVSLGNRCDDEIAVVLWLCLIEGDNDDYL